MNNTAIITRVSETVEISGADNVHVANVLGEFCITSKNVQKGDVGILFPEGLQLSEEFVFENNLSRDKEKNKNPEKTGFFEANRRVRAQTFLKVRSTALFMPLSSVRYTGADESSLVVGAQFNDLNGKEICKKYMNEKTLRAKTQGQAKAMKKNKVPFFVEHVDTSQFKHNVGRIQEGDLIYFHAKKHGTSGRTAYTSVFVDLPWWKKAINKLAPVFSESKYEIVTGTRRVVLQTHDVKEGFHGSENFRKDISDKLGPLMSKGMTLYYEIVGYVNGKGIMPTHSVKALKDKAYTKKYGDSMEYKYGCMQGQHNFHIYRITVQGVDGEIRDLSQREMEKWCEQRELPCTLEVFPPMVYNGDEEALRILVDKLTERPEVLTEDYEDPSHVSEGIVLRIENGNSVPLFLKSKSYAFRCMEGLCEAEDAEDAS